MDNMLWEIKTIWRWSNVIPAPIFHQQERKKDKYFWLFLCLFEGWAPKACECTFINLQVFPLNLMCALFRFLTRAPNEIHLRHTDRKLAIKSFQGCLFQSPKDGSIHFWLQMWLKILPLKWIIKTLIGSQGASKAVCVLCTLLPACTFVPSCTAAMITHYYLRGPWQAQNNNNISCLML